jgi:hypothetical protein
VNPKGVEKEKRKNTSRRKEGCVLFAFVLLLPLCLCTGLIWFVTQNTSNNFDLYQSKWDMNKPASYSAEIWIIDELEYRLEIDGDPIDYMFQLASACELNFPENLICTVEYDETYGYPKSIGGGIYESSYIRVMNFQVHDNE